ncbi:MAG: M28 family metallopeptidase [Bryobacteraceae bacterium]
MPHRIRRTLTVLLLTAWFAAVCLAASAGDIAAAVSQDKYRDQLRHQLSTHAGANRFAAVLGAEHDKTRDYIHEQFKAAGLETYLDPFAFYRPNPPYQGVFSGVNVVAKIPGTVHPEKQWILGAHYDSAGTPGADDNASGVAALLEAARVLAPHKFECTILLIAFDFEEIGLSGSTSYVQRHPDDQILGMLSLDMIAYNPGGRNRAEVWTGRPGENTVSQAVMEAVRRYAGGIVPEYRGRSGSSDHAPFATAGFESALLIEAVPYSPYYHKPTDAATCGDPAEPADATLEDGAPYLDYAFGAKMTRAAVGWLVEAAVLVEEPAAKPEPIAAPVLH